MEKVFIIDSKGAVREFSKDCENCEFYVAGRYSSYMCKADGPYRGEAVGPYFSCVKWELAGRIVSALAIRHGG